MGCFLSICIFACIYIYVCIIIVINEPVLVLNDLIQRDPFEVHTRVLANNKNSVNSFS